MVNIETTRKITIKRIYKQQQDKIGLQKSLECTIDKEIKKASKKGKSEVIINSFLHKNHLHFFYDMNEYQKIINQYEKEGYNILVKKYGVLSHKICISW